MLNSKFLKTEIDGIKAYAKRYNEKFMHFGYIADNTRGKSIRTVLNNISTFARDDLDITSNLRSTHTYGYKFFTKRYSGEGVSIYDINGGDWCSLLVLGDDFYLLDNKLGLLYRFSDDSEGKTRHLINGLKTLFKGDIDTLIEVLDCLGVVVFKSEVGNVLDVNLSKSKIFVDHIIKN